MHKLAGRAALIGVMLGGGLLSAGISQAQDAGASDMRAERSAELAAASGGPASSAHLIAFAADRAAVETRDDDVAALTPTTTTPSEPSADAVAKPAQEAAQVSRVATADLPVDAKR